MIISTDSSQNNFARKMSPTEHVFLWQSHWLNRIDTHKVVHIHTLWCVQGQFAVKAAEADRRRFEQKITHLWACTVFLCACVSVHVYSASPHVCFFLFFFFLSVWCFYPCASCHLLSCVNCEHRKVWGKVDESLCWLSPPPLYSLKSRS